MDRSWFAVASSMVLLILTVGFVHSFGELYNPILKDFNTTKSIVASIGAIQQSLKLIAAPIGSVILDRVGYRKTAVLGMLLCLVGLITTSFATNIYQLYMTFGSYGVGAGLILNTCINLVGECFSTCNSSRAFAILTSGIPIGTFLFNVVGYYLFNVYDWRSSLLLLAGTSFVVFGTILPLFTPPDSSLCNNTALDHDRTDLWKYVIVFRNPKFVTYLLGVMTLSFSLSFQYITFVADTSVILNDSESGTVAVSIISLSDIIALIVLAAVGDRLPTIRRNLMSMTLLLVTGPSALVFAFAEKPMLVYAATVCSGFSRGILFSSAFSLAVEIFGAERGQESLTHTILAMGIGTLIGPIILSYVSFKFTYTAQYLTCAASSALSASLFIIESCMPLNEPVPVNEKDDKNCSPTDQNYGAITESLLTSDMALKQ